MNNKIDESILSLIKRIRSIQSLSKYDYFSDILTDTEQDIRERVFRLTVVGEFSSGKSTFLNAIIGRDILPHAVSETTATITYIHNVPEKDEMNNKAIVHFNDDSRNDETIDIIKEKKKFQDYLSALNGEGLDVVNSVDVYTNFANINDPIVIVDTPGMNGTADGHRDITMREIKRSHASICLFHLKGVGQTDLDFMEELMHYQDTFFFVLNQIDDLKSTEGETPESRIASFAEEIKGKVYKGLTTPQRVYGISALNALASRDTDIEYLYESDKKYGNILTDLDRKDCWTRSRFAVLEKDLFDYLASNEKDVQFYESVIQRIESLLKEFIESGERKKHLYEVDINSIPEKKLIEEELENIKKAIDSSKAKLTHQLGAEISDLEKKMKDQTKTNCTKKYESVIREINGIGTIEELEDYNKNIGGNVMTFHATQANSLITEINSGCNVIYAQLVDSVNRMIPRLEFSKKEVRSSIDMSFDKSGDYETSDDIERQKRERERLEKERAQKSHESIQIKQKMKQAKGELDLAYSDKQKELDAVPAPRQWTERVKVGSHIERTKRQGFWGGVARFFTFGTCGYDEKVVDDYNDVARNNYGERSRDINRINNKYSFIEDVEQDIVQYKQLIGMNEKMDKDLQRRIKECNEKIEKAKAELKYLQENAKSSLLRDRKGKLIGEIERWLNNNGEVYNDLAEGIRCNIEKCRAAMNTEIIKLYDTKMKEYEEEMEIVLNTLITQGDNREKVKEVETISGDIRIVNDCLSELLNIKMQL